MLISACEIQKSAQWHMDRAKCIIMQDASKTYDHSLFHGEGIFRWKAN